MRKLLHFNLAFQIQPLNMIPFSTEPNKEHLTLYRILMTFGRKVGNHRIKKSLKPIPALESESEAPEG